MNDSKTVVEDLAAWLTQIWDEEERLARRVADRYVTPAGRVYWPRPRVEAAFSQGDDPDILAGLDLIKRHDPASVLARIAADRKILAWCTERDRIWVGTIAADPSDPANYVPGSLAHPTDSVVLRLMAQAYSDRPGFRPEWSVERQGVEW